MNQIFNELVKQKTKTNRDNAKIYNNIETNEDEKNKIKKKLEKLRQLFVIEKLKMRSMMIFF